MSDIEDHIKRLQDADLYKLTEDDWSIHISVSLTEPTCPTVIIAKDGSNSVRYRTDRNSIEEGVAAAVDLAYREIVEGHPIESECPFTNPDDRPGTEKGRRS